MDELVRIFTGVARPGAAEDFGKYLTQVAVPEMKRRNGLRSIDVVADGAPHLETFLVTTTWTGIDSLKGFTRRDVTQPVLSVPEREMLGSASVRHFRRLLPPQRKLETSLVMEDESRTIMVNGLTVELPPLEYRLFAALHRHAPEPVSSAELARMLWPGSAYAHSSDVRRLVFRLRRVLAQAGSLTPTIRTRSGIGYMLETSAATAWQGPEAGTRYYR